MLWPCWWGVGLAASGLPDLRLMLLFALGAVVMRSAGCIVNDLWDKDLDRQVARTRDRPLASGALSTRQALIFLGGLLGVGLLVLLSFNLTVVQLGAASLPLVLFYPVMKRITWWPQLFLGLTFNWGALLGVAAVTGRVVTLPSVLLYVAGIFWTLGYDTIYAHQDKKDDARVGIKSTALRLAKHPRLWVGLFYAACLIFLLSAGIFQGFGLIYGGGLVLAALFMAVQLKKWNPDDPANCLRRFKANQIFGGIVWASILAASFSASL